MKKLKVMCLIMIIISVLSSCNSSKSKILTLQTNNKNCCAQIPDIKINDVMQNAKYLTEPLFTDIIAVISVKKCGCIDNEAKQNECFAKFKKK